MCSRDSNPHFRQTPTVTTDELMRPRGRQLSICPTVYCTDVCSVQTASNTQAPATAKAVQYLPLHVMSSYYVTISTCETGRLFTSQRVSSQQKMRVRISLMWDYVYILGEERLKSNIITNETICLEITLNQQMSLFVTCQ